MNFTNGIACIGILEKCDFDKIKCADVYKQTLLDNFFKIPHQKPPMENILQLFIEPKINSTKIIETPFGNKNIVTGTICYKIVYTAQKIEQPVHSAHFQKDFCVFINCKEESNCHNACNSFNVTPHIEDVEIKVLDDKRFIVCTMLLIVINCCDKNSN